MDPHTEQLIKAGLRSVAVSVPGAASLVQAWSEYESVQQSRRLEDFFFHFAEQLRDLRQGLQDLDQYVKTSGELPILMERVVLKVTREASEAKRHRFAVALTRCLTAPPKVTYDDKLSIIDTLDTLAERDIEVLSLFSPNRPRLVSTMFQQTLRPFDAQATRDAMADLVTSLTKLEARGLIAQSTTQGAGGVISFTDAPDHWTTRWQQKAFELLPFGIMFLDAIRPNA